MSDTVSVTLTAAGRVNTPPATLLATIISGASALSAGLTADLPGTLIEDIAGTDTGAAVVLDSCVTEWINDVGPITANAYVLTQLAQIYLGQGTAPATPTNTSVYCVFSTGTTAGQIIPPGFTVSDGTYQYVVQNGGVTQGSGSTQPLYCLASQAGTWAVISNSVTQLVTSAPTGVTLTVTNPEAGTPSTSTETEGQFRTRVLQAGLCTSTGMPNYLKTLLQAVPGVQANLVSVRNPSANQFEIIVGGTANPYDIAYAIYQSVQDVSTLVGSTIQVLSATLANPCVITLSHTLPNFGQIVISGALGLTSLNGTWSPSGGPTLFQYVLSSLNSSAGPAYTGGATVLPVAGNSRNISVTISDYPDAYTVPFVLPPVQYVTIVVTWNTSSLNYVSDAAVAALVQPAIADYINGLSVGVPINELEMTSIFQTAVLPILATNLITRLVFSVTINGFSISPGTGQATVFGDTESYFSISQSSITVTQG